VFVEIILLDCIEGLTFYHVAVPTLLKFLLPMIMVRCCFPVHPRRLNYLHSRNYGDRCRGSCARDVVSIHHREGPHCVLWSTNERRVVNVKGGISEDVE
jgi:hypothetical protein